MGGFAGGDEAGFWDEHFTDEKDTQPLEKNSPTVMHGVLDFFTFVFLEENGKSFRISFTSIDHSQEPSYVEKEYQEDLKKVYALLLQRADAIEVEGFFDEYYLDIYEEACVDTTIKKATSFVQAYFYLMKDVYNLIIDDSELDELILTVS